VIHLLFAVCTVLHCKTLSVDIRPARTVAQALPKGSDVYDLRLRNCEFVIEYESES
jgi:hypothetical protein